MWKTATSLASSLADVLSLVAPTRVHRIVWGLVNLVAVGCAFVPLFDLVGYESAALFGAILGFFALGMTVWSVRGGGVEPPLEDDRTRSPADDFGRLALRHLALAVGPVLILSLNAVRVPNCDWASGFAFWALIVIPAVLIGQTAGWVTTAAFADRRVLCWLTALGLPLLDVAYQLQHLALQPPIITHQWFIGYFGGSIYDEALAVPTSLIVYRLIQLAAIVAIVAAIEVAWRRKKGTWPGWTTAVAVVGVLAFAVGFAHRQDAGISIDRGHVVDTLGATVESEHFVIHYPNRRPYLDRVDEMVADHEFRYHQMRRFYGTDPVAESGRKVRSFVYGDRSTKSDLMGSRSTMVAKLWLHEMHILWSDTGDRMLAHELAHIFTEPFGAGPLRLSMQRGIGVNMGLVEGAAVAAEWPTGQMNPHEASAAMRRHDIDPRLDAILGATSFWTEASGPAYTAMGSFSRYLIDEYGIEAFKAAYPRGDFEGAYGREVGELIAEWEEFVDAIELTPQQKAVAAHRYDRPSIFEKVCARALAERRLQARGAHSAGALAEALRLYESVLDDDPLHVGSHRRRVQILMQKGRFDDALEAIEQRPREAMTEIDEARFLELKGDVLWSSGDGQRAASTYDEVLQKGLGDAQQRSLVVKRRLAGDGQDWGLRYLIERTSSTYATYLVGRIHRKMPDDPVVSYLLGRRLFNGGYHAEAIPHLERVDSALEHEALDAEALRMLGEAYLHEGRFDASKSVWERLLDSDRSRYRQAAEQWLSRAAWAEAE